MRTSVFAAVFFSFASFASAGQVSLRRQESSVQLLATVEQQACLNTCVDAFAAAPNAAAACFDSSDETEQFACLCAAPAAVASLEACVAAPCPGVVPVACNAARSRAQPSPSASPAEFEVINAVPAQAASTHDETFTPAPMVSTTTIGMPHVAVGMGLMFIFWLVLPS